MLECQLTSDIYSSKSLHILNYIFYKIIQFLVTPNFLLWVETRHERKILLNF